MQQRRQVMTDSNLHFEAKRAGCGGELLSEVMPTRVCLPAEDGIGAQQVIRSVGVNTFCQIGSQLAPAIAAIAGIPFLLRHLGQEAYGIVTLFSTALIYFTMLDLGLGRAATRFIAQSLEGGRLDEVRRYFWSSILLLTGVGLLVSVCGWLAVPPLVSHYLKISTAYYHATAMSFYLICATIPLVTLTAGLRGLLEAAGKFPFISAVTALCGVALYLLPSLAVMAGGGLVSIAVAYVAVRIGMGIAFGIGCGRVKDRPSLKPTFDRTAVRKMLSFGSWLSVSNIIGTAMVYGDRFLLGFCVGMTAVTSYSVPLDVIGRMQILVTSFCAVLFPLMSRLDESGSNRFQTIYRGAMALVLSLITPLTVAMVLLSPWLMKLWLRARNTPDAVFSAQVFLAGAVVQALASVSFTALHARGRSDVPAWVHMAEFPIYCGAFYWAATRFGVRGAAIVWLGRVIVDFVCMVVLLRLRDGSPMIAPELVASLVSIAVLAVALPTGNAAALAGAICALTWLWTWRTLLDSRMRKQLTRVIGLGGPAFGRSPAG